MKNVIYIDIYKKYADVKRAYAQNVSVTERQYPAVSFFYRDKRQPILK